MVSRSLIKLSKEVGRVSVPSYIQSFLKDHPNIHSFKEAYDEMCENLPDSIPVPHLNEAILYYNLARLQDVADSQLLAIRSSEQKLEELMEFPDENKDKILWYKHNIERLEKKYHEIAKDLLKLSDSGVTRDTPKQINVQNNTNINLMDIHEKIREIKSMNTFDESDNEIKNITPE